MNPREPTVLRYMEFEPRWHGWAQWELRLEQKMGETAWAIIPMHKGWKRRPKGSRYAEYVIGSCTS